MSDVKDLAQAGNKNIASLEQKFEATHCLLLPVNKEILLLPNAAVAEIVPYQEPEAADNAPDWFVGYLSWRDHRLPVISIEAASDGEVGKIHKNCRIAVLNTLNGNSELPYIAIIMQGLPSLQIVRPDSLQKDDSEQRQSISANVTVNGAEALIPNLDDLETRIQQLHT